MRKRRLFKDALVLALCAVCVLLALVALSPIASAITLELDTGPSMMLAEQSPDLVTAIATIEAVDVALEAFNVYDLAIHASARYESERSAVAIRAANLATLDYRRAWSTAARYPLRC